MYMKCQHCQPVVLVLWKITNSNNYRGRSLHLKCPEHRSEIPYPEELFSENTGTFIEAAGGCWSPVIHKSMINVWLLAECKVEEFLRHRYRDGISWREREISLARTNIGIMNTTAGGFPGNYQEIDIPSMHTISLFNLITWTNAIRFCLIYLLARK